MALKKNLAFLLFLVVIFAGCAINIEAAEYFSCMSNDDGTNEACSQCCTDIQQGSYPSTEHEQCVCRFDGKRQEMSSEAQKRMKGSALWFPLGDDSEGFKMEHK